MLQSFTAHLPVFMTAQAPRHAQHPQHRAVHHRRQRTYTMTGLAMMNIFALVPSTRPSVLNSMAALTTALAKPVMVRGCLPPAFRGQLLVEAQRRQQCRQRHQRAAGERPGQLSLSSPMVRYHLAQHLAQKADAAAHAKRPEAVQPRPAARAGRRAAPCARIPQPTFSSCSPPGNRGCPPVCKNIHTLNKKEGSIMNLSVHHSSPPAFTCAEVRCRRRAVLAVTVVACVAVGGAPSCSAVTPFRSPAASAASATSSASAASEAAEKPQPANADRPAGAGHSG